MDHDTLLALIDRLYEASTQPELWPDAVAGIRSAIGSGSVWMQARDPKGGLAMTPIRLEADPEAVEAYMSHYWQHDPWVAGWLRRPIDGVFQGDELVDREVLRRSAFYNDYSKAQDSFHFLGSAAKVGAGTQLMLALYRPEHHAEFDGAERRLLERLVPHLTRAMGVTLALRGANAVRDAVGGALEGLDLGVVVLNRGGMVVYANHKAERLAATRDGLRLGRDGIAARDPREDTRLQSAIRAVLSGVGTETPPAPLPISPKVGPPLSALVVPTVGGEIAHDAAVLILLHDPNTIPPSASMIAELSGLTPAEARLLDALLAGETPADHAQRHGLSRNTVKTQLAQLFAKTGTSRQARLVQWGLGNLLLRWRHRL